MKKIMWLMHDCSLQCFLLQCEMMLICVINKLVHQVIIVFLKKKIAVEILNIEVILIMMLFQAVISLWCRVTSARVLFLDAINRLWWSSSICTLDYDRRFASLSRQFLSLGNLPSQIESSSTIWIRLSNSDDNFDTNLIPSRRSPFWLNFDLFLIKVD